MAPTKPANWIAAANAAAVRLAAEAGAEADEILEPPGSASLSQLGLVLDTLEQGIEAVEVATDLAGLLWAECEVVPPIVTILSEPATQAALLAVAEARRLAAKRVAVQVQAAESRGARRQVAPQYQVMGALAALDPAKAHLWRRPGSGQRRP